MAVAQGLGKPLFPPQIPAGPVELVGAKNVFADVWQFAAIEFGSSMLVVLSLLGCARAVTPRSAN
jgi:hypothetical protein